MSFIINNLHVWVFCDGFSWPNSKTLKKFAILFHSLKVLSLKWYKKVKKKLLYYVYIVYTNKQKLYYI